ncbi:MAG: ABC transporter permease [Euzebyaceae bacterium]|nr:ABC transporter permease [Euzebyaceae bacterium]
MSATAPKPAPAVEAPAASAGASERRRRAVRLATDSTALIFVALLVLLAIFSALKPGAFATVNNLRNISIAAAPLLVLGVGMTFVIITAGIDLSVGSVLVFSGVIAVKVMTALGNSGWGVVVVGTVAAMLTGLAWGLVNGALIAKARIPALIVTLGTLGAGLGGAQLITGGVNLRGVPRELVTVVGVGRLFGVVPWLVAVALVVTVVGAVALRMTRFGRYTFAIGSNAEAARRVGINVDRHLIKVYALSGMLAGLAGMISLARFTNTTIAGHSTDNLQAIAAVVIGGTSLFGGVGTILGTVVGVFIPAVLQNGFVILRVQPFWQEVAVGVVLIAAVYVDQLKRRARDRL